MKKFTTNEELLNFGSKVFATFEEEQSTICDECEVLDELEVDGIHFKRHLWHDDSYPMASFCYKACVDNVGISVWYFKNIALHEVILMPGKNHKFLSEISTVYKTKEHLKKQLESIIELHYSLN